MRAFYTDDGKSKSRVRNWPRKGYHAEFRRGSALPMERVNLRTMSARISTLAVLFGSILLSNAAESLVASIPVKMQRGGRIILSGKVNEKGPFTFLVDSACTVPTLHPALVDELGLQPSGRVRIQGIAGLERAPTYRNVVFDFGEAQYKPRRIASVPSERDHARRRDGVIGSGFLETFVVEFRPKEKLIKLHTPSAYEYSGKGEIVPFRLREEIPVVEAAVQLANGSTLKGEFEIDTGCDSGVCLGEHFVRQHNLVEELAGKKSEKFGIGGSVETSDARIPVFRIAGREFKNIQADLFLDGSPVDEPLAGHIGMSLLGRATIIFDYARKRIILEQ